MLSRSAHRIDAWRGSKEYPRSPLDRGESLQEDGTISQRRKGRMELAYFDTETPYIKFQSFPARSFAPKAREHALPRHPPSSLLPLFAPWKSSAIARYAESHADRGETGGRRGVICISRGFQKFEGGTPSGGDDDFINIETRHLCWKLVIRPEATTATTNAIRSSFSSLFFFSLSSPSSLLPFFQFRRNRQGSVYHTDEFNRSLSRSVGVEDAGNQADATVVR